MMRVVQSVAQRQRVPWLRHSATEEKVGKPEGAAHEYSG